MASGLLAVAALTGCEKAPRAPSAREPWRDPHPHEVRLIDVGGGVRLEVLDWGGAGPPVVLLAGMGNTAHVFDDFVELLPGFRVIAITRRGFGASTQPAGGYDIATFVADDLAVLDALGLATASFVGHSFAGEELMSLGVEHGARVRRLVFLDAAYDRTAIEDEGAPPPPEPLARDLASARAFREFLARSQGAAWPESEVRAALVVDEAGRIRNHRTPDAIVEAAMKTVSSPVYARLRSAALAIYRVDDSAEQLFPYWPTLDASAKAKARSFYTRAFAQLAAERTRFRREVVDARVIEFHGADHFVFLQPRERTAEAVRAFLAP